MMQSQYKIYFTVVLLCALGAGIFCARFVRSKMVDPNKKAVTVQAGPTVQVLVAKQDIRAGSEFSARNIKFMLFPEKEVPRDAVFETKGFLGHKSANDIPKDSFLTLFDVQMQKEKEETATTFLPAGYSNIPVRIENVYAGERLGNISNFITMEEIIRPGDKVQVSVIRSVWEKEGENGHQAVPKLSTKLLVPAAVVGKISAETRNSSSGIRRYSIITLQLDKKSTDLIKRESATGKICVAPILSKKAETMPLSVNGVTFTGNSNGINQLVNVSRKAGNESASNLNAGNTGFSFGINLNNASSAVHEPFNIAGSSKSAAPIENKPLISNTLPAASNDQPVKVPALVQDPAATSKNIPVSVSNSDSPAPLKTMSNSNFSFGIHLNDNKKPDAAANVTTLPQNSSDTESNKTITHAHDDILEKSTVNYPVLPGTAFNPIVPANTQEKPASAFSGNSESKKPAIQQITKSDHKSVSNSKVQIDSKKKEPVKDAVNEKERKDSSLEKQNKIETSGIFQNASNTFRSRTK